MKRTLLTLALPALLAACGMSNDEIGTTVRQSMQQTLDTSSDFKSYKLAVKDVTVLKQSGNQYKGLVKVETEGESHDVAVDITVDGQKVMWNAPPGSFSFIAQREFRKALSQ